MSKVSEITHEIIKSLELLEAAIREEAEAEGALKVYGSSWTICKKHLFLFGSKECGYCKVLSEEGKARKRDES